MRSPHYLLGSTRRAEIVLLALVLLGGCSSAQQRVYDLSIDNRSSHDVTVGLVKDGPPFEWAWAAPEDIVRTHPEPGAATWGHFVEPGQIVHLIMQGNFDSKSVAVLRVYAGHDSLYDLLAIRHDDPNRVFMSVPPGSQAVVVTESAHRVIHVIPVEPAGVPVPMPPAMQP